MRLSTFRDLARRARKAPWTWRYGFNCGATVLHALERNGMSAEAARVVAELDRNGVALTTADRLLGVSGLFEEVQSAVAELERDRTRAITAAREAGSRRGFSGEKNFIYRLLGDRPVMDRRSVFARFALQDPVLGIANRYFGMYTRLRYYNVWRTFRTEELPHESQLWHRDREDYYILKLFVYLSDVDEGAGPLTYAPGSHRKGAPQREPEHFLEGGVRRSRDDQMAEALPRERWLHCVGPKGTLVFVDAAGYHKGGLARRGERLFYTAMFTSPAAQSDEVMAAEDGPPPGLDRARRFALGGRRTGL